MVHTGQVHPLYSRSLLALALAVAAACSGDDGRELPAPTAGQTTSSVSAPAVGQPAEGVPSLSSPSFSAGGTIPDRHTCFGDDVSPTLIWLMTEPAAELAIVVRDRDAGGYVHWIVTGIDPAVQGIGEGGIPEGAVAGANSGGTAGWLGPCPPGGTGTHTYDFAVHALPEPLALDPLLPADQAAQAIEGASSDHVSLAGTVAAR